MWPLFIHWSTLLSRVRLLKSKQEKKNLYKQFYCLTLLYWYLSVLWPLWKGMWKMCCFKHVVFNHIKTWGKVVHVNPLRRTVFLKIIWHSEWLLRTTGMADMFPANKNLCAEITVNKENQFFSVLWKGKVWCRVPGTAVRGARGRSRYLGENVVQLDRLWFPSEQARGAQEYFQTRDIYRCKCKYAT